MTSTHKRAPNELSALEAARAIEKGQLSSEALVRACLERIALRNSEVLAFTAVDEAFALRQARAADAAGTAGRGPLHGVPFAAKDVFDSADLPTAYGSPIYAGHRPRSDAACIALAREQGALLLGKVATSEFATQTPSTARHPLDLQRTPGGSSSGSAVAVADSMVPVAFGTQTTASIVRPAAYCGVVGYKPSFGFIGTAGMKPLSPSQDTVGLLTRSVADAAFFAFGLHGTPLAPPEGLRPRLALCRSKQWDALEPAMAQALERLAADCERRGARVREIVLPPALEDLVALQLRLFAFEARQSLSVERLQHGDQLSPRLQQRLAGGLGIAVDDYLAMRQRVAAAQTEVAALFADVDALLYPPAQGEAPLGLADSGSAQFGALWSLLQLPCVSVPMARGPNGMPLGVQAIGAFGSDAKLLAVAKFVEACGQPAA